MVRNRVRSDVLALWKLLLNGRVDTWGLVITSVKILQVERVILEQLQARVLDSWVLAVREHFQAHVVVRQAVNSCRHVAITHDRQLLQRVRDVASIFSERGNRSHAALKL